MLKQDLLPNEKVGGIFSSTVVMTGEEIRRALIRMAHEITERNKTIDNLVFIGMRTRGVPIAKRLSDNIALFEKIVVPFGILDYTSHRDDLNHRSLKINSSEIPCSVNGKTIILVDDVLYTGRSARAAMDAIIDLGRPDIIQLAVLVDRGHRELPIKADFVGKNIPSSHNEKVQVKLIENDGMDEVRLSSLKQ
jgi:pyrimidine operon attenuation protein/uracil phosphoribosyltransferase